MRDKTFKKNAALGAISRRDLMLRGVSLAAVGGAGLPLLACGGGGSAAAFDTIWGAGAAADQIVASLAFLKPSMFPATVFNVTTYGAQTITPVTYGSALNPYVDPAVSSAAQVTASQYGFTTGALASGTPGSNTYANMTIAGAFDSRLAFIAAIAACHAAGGGQVLVPAGNYYCGGPITLLSNVHFHLAANCTIYFSPNPADYAKDGPYNCGANGNLFYSRWQGNDCLNYGSPINAFNQTNIAVTGTDQTSILNGQAMVPYASSNAGNPAAPATLGTTTFCWWTMKGTASAWGCATTATTMGTQGSFNSANLDLLSFGSVEAPNIYTNGAAGGGTNWLYTLLGTGSLTAPTAAAPAWTTDSTYLPALAEAGVSPTLRIFGKGHYLPPPMIQFIGCTNVLMQNYTTQQTPFWQHNPVNCTNVLISGVYTNSLGPNNDGFDPDACNNVLIDTVNFNTGDDCIAIKSGKDGDTQYGPCNNILIQNCTMNSGHGGITIGSEMMAGAQNIYARNLTMTNQYWNVNPLNIGIRFKTNMNRGGFIKNVYVNGVSLPNGIMTVGKTDSTGITGSPISATQTLGVAGASTGNPSTSQGGVITFDCDYSPNSDAVRNRPPVVNNIQIQNVTVGNITPSSGTSGFNAAASYPASCFQAVVMQGPVKTDYNGPLPVPTVLPITNVSITNCNFGNPVCPATAASSASPSAIYAWSVSNVTLDKVQISGTTISQVLNDVR